MSAVSPGPFRYNFSFSNHLNCNCCVYPSLYHFQQLLTFANYWPVIVVDYFAAVASDLAAAKTEFVIVDVVVAVALVASEEKGDFY